MEQNIRKIVVSAGVVLGFVAYASYQRGSGGDSAVVAPFENSNDADRGAHTRIRYKDGEYTGDVIDAFYGDIQVKAVVQGGKIVDILFLKYPDNRETSVKINMQAMPILATEAIAAQTAEVDIVSGATQTAEAFIGSLKSALLRAKI